MDALLQGLGFKVWGLGFRGFRVHKRKEGWARGLFAKLWWCGYGPIVESNLVSPCHGVYDKRSHPFCSPVRV